MRERHLYVILIAVGVLIGVMVVVFRSPPEPEYGGKKLSEWVNSFYMPRPEATKAVRSMGTKAVPYLLNWMRYDIPPWREKLCDMVNPMIARIRPRWVFDYK